MSDSNFSAIRARLRYGSIEEFIDGYARFISAGGMFIPMAANKLKPIGTTIRFQFLLAEGATALLGEGVVVQVRPPEEGNPKAPVGMLVKFSKLSQESKNLVDQIVAMKEFGALGGSEPEPEPEPEMAPEPEQAAAESLGDADSEEYDQTHEMNLQDYLAADAERMAAESQETAAEPEDEEPAAEEPVAQVQPTHGPRKLGQTEGGLQILAFDDMSDEEAGEMAFDLGAEESDIDEMFAGIFGGDSDAVDEAVFGDMFNATPPEPEAQPEEEVVEEPEEELAEESEEELAEESEEELVEEPEEELVEESEEELVAASEEELVEESAPAVLDEVADESELPADSAASDADEDFPFEEEELASEVEDEPAEEEPEPFPDDEDDEELYDEPDEAAEASEPFPADESEPEVSEPEVSEPQEGLAEESLPTYSTEEGPSLTFPAGWDHGDEPSEAEPNASVDEMFEDESEAAGISEPSSAESLDFDSDVELIEGSEAELLLDESEAEPQSEEKSFENFDQFAEESEPEPEQEPVASEPEVDDGKPSELENLLGNLESDPRAEREMDLHLANDPMAQFEDPPEAVEPDDDDEESLDFLLAAANKEIAALHTDEPADTGGDILDDLLGDVANLPPPPTDTPVFAPPTADKKKKGGFLSKLFGKD